MAQLSKDMKLRKKTCAEVKEKEVGTLNSLQVQHVFLLPHFVQLPPNLPMSSCYCFSFNRCVGVQVGLSSQLTVRKEHGGFFFHNEMWIQSFWTFHSAAATDNIPKLAMCQPWI
jgi:hypothetical protein